jgi:hypothetical protein
MESEDYEESVTDPGEDNDEGADEEYDSFDEEYGSVEDDDFDVEMSQDYLNMLRADQQEDEVDGDWEEWE